MKDSSRTAGLKYEDQAPFWGAVVLLLLAAEIALGCALSLVWRVAIQ